MLNDDLPQPFASVRDAVKLLASDCSNDNNDHESALVSIADAVQTTRTPSLNVYRLAALLCESHIRQLAQILIFRGATAFPSAARLLLTMHGLPGNEELVNDLVTCLKSDASVLDSQTLSIVSFLAGPAVIESNICSTALSNAFANDEASLKLALAFAFNIHPGAHHEHVSHVRCWDMEMPFADCPSVWRELKWAAFARSKSVSVGCMASPLVTAFRSKATLIDLLPASAGQVSQHYLRICGVPMRRRHIFDQNKPPSECPLGSAANSDKTPSFIVTPTLQPVLLDIAIALGHGLPFVLEGQTGCGKTCLLSHLARETAHGASTNEAPGVTFVQLDSVSRDGEAESFDDLVGGIVPLPEGKGFRWRPGPIGLAVQRGEWVILENIARCAASPSAVSLLQRLASIRVGQFLEAPGRGEPIPVAPGFRCIATRTTDSASEDAWQPPGGPDLWLRFEMPSPSDDDVTAILSKRFPRVADCINRVIKSVKAVAAYTTRHSSPVFVHPNIRQASRICGRLDNLRNDGGNVTAEMALQECLDTLVGWCADEKHCNMLISIVAPCWSLTNEVAKGLFSSLSPSYCEESQELQIGRATYPLPDSKKHSSTFTLALTSHTLRLLERLLRCFQMKENILLTGEAGSGKTAVLQELANLFGKELVVVNLSRQSELSDLLGGFKPVELAALITNLCRRFEELFCSCFTREKNHRFLDTLQRAARVSSEHQKALRLMKGAINAMRQRVKQDSSSAKWTDIAHEVESLESSLFPPDTSHSVELDVSGHRSDQNGVEPPRKRSRCSKSRKRPRVEFRFSEGVLVRAMRQGKWILLDEINLAPSELLERLVSVVDRGQVLLSNENGDVVNQAAGFMIFGAMNPPTDAGKRPLPAVLRTRFSEFYVGDVKDPRDVSLLVVHRFFRKPFNDLSITRDEINMAEDVARFFLHCCQLSREGRVEDTAGKPVRFSVRTLSRMLDFASGVRHFFKPGTDSIRRALFEGALVAFATSLPRNCKSLVVTFAKKTVLRPSKTSKNRTISAMMAIPPNRSSSVRYVEGYPIESASIEDQHFEEANRRTDFIISPMVKNTLTEISRSMALGAPKYPVLLQGPTAAGKTSIVTYLAEITGTELIRINNHEHTELTEYIGGYVVTAEGSLQFSEGPLVRAARHGHWVLLDELNLAPPDVLEALNRLLDDNREIFIPETGELIKAAPGFRLFATQNPPTLYGGRKELSRAFRSRFVEVHVDDLPDKDLLMILERKGAIPASFAKGMISVMRQLQLHRRSSGMFRGREGFVTARDLFRWAFRQPRSREELAVHGFLLLGERARQPAEREVVRDVLIKVLRIAPNVISDTALYNLEEGSIEKRSPSQECLDFSLDKLKLSREKLFETLETTGIVLTPHMSRMIILILHSMANREPALLVGATGSGKTSCCEVLCNSLERALLSVNCHRHTEASDIVGGFRPVRSSNEDGRLFEWCDGPLIEAMKTGCGLLVDEINMVEDAVIERLNSVLEHGRSFLLSEKGSAVSKSNQSTSPELIVAHPQFTILATMNPGGDFGKKELSPALRNRFTEMWIPQPTSLEDYAPIVDRRLASLSEQKANVQCALLNFLHFVLTLDQKKEKKAMGPFSITLRDLRAWCDFIVDASTQCGMSPLTAVMHGAQQVFLDGISVGSLDPNASETAEMLSKELIALLPRHSQADVRAHISSFGSSIEWADDGGPFCLRVHNFQLRSNPQSNSEEEGFYSFSSENTKRNTARLCRAICVGQHPILLEGPPGGGKTSLVAALAMKARFQFIRVNLSESTEMSDLVGSDAPGKTQGTFSFREGPLLKALKEGHWLLLDELNLASQTVLEGLNSVLDHRRSVFVPELNKEVTASQSFRVFGAQNPAVEGSGRRGLPKSFLNRFAKVWIEPPSHDDTSFILSSLYPAIPLQIRNCIVNMMLLLKRIHFNYGTFGLRDVLRWCDILSKSVMHRGSAYTPCQILDLPSNTENLELVSTHLNESFDAVVLQRLDHQAKQKAIAAFEAVFGFPFRKSSYTPSLSSYSEGDLRIGVSMVKRMGCFTQYHKISETELAVLSSRIAELQALSLSINHGWPTVFFSDVSENLHTHSEGRRLFEILASISGKHVRIVHGGSLANGDDFIGGYSQQDLLWILRTAVREWRNVLGKFVQCLLTGNHANSSIVLTISTEIQNFLRAITPHIDNCPGNDISNIARFFAKTSSQIASAIEEEKGLTGLNQTIVQIKKLNHNLNDFLSVVSNESFASFEWRKSDLLTSIENGDWIFVEDADQCPPAVLDRLNPLFERPPLPARNGSTPIYPQKVLLAEAPTNEEGSSVHLVPHQDFRMGFSVRSVGEKTSNFGLSRALLDRSLRIDLKHTIGDSESSLIYSTTGLPLSIKKDALPWICGNYHIQATRMRLIASLGIFNECSGSIENQESVTISESPVDGQLNEHKSQINSIELSFHPDNTLLEVDLASLCFIENAPSNFTSFIVEKALKLLSIPQPSDVFSSVNKTLTIENLTRNSLLSSAAYLFVLSSTSLVNAKVRTSILKSRTGKQILSATYNCYGEVADEAQKAIQDEAIVALAEKELTDVGIKLDPIYSMDSQIVNGLQFSISTTYASKLFRVLVLQLQRLLSLWNYGEEISVWGGGRQKSLFAQAKTSCDLGEQSSQSLNRFATIAYRIVQTVVSNSASLCSIIDPEGWSTPVEESIRIMLTATVQLCEILTSKSLLNDWTCLIGPLLDWNSSLSFFESILSKKDFILQFFTLRNEVRELTASFTRALTEFVPLSMPRTEKCQQLETKLTESINKSRKEALFLPEVDAITKAVLSIRVQEIEANGNLLHTFEGLADTLQSRTDSAPTNSSITATAPVDHWSKLTQTTAINSLLTILYNDVQDSDVANLKTSIQFASRVLKCLQPTLLYALFAVQRIQWLIGSGKLDTSTDRQADAHLLKPFISSSLRAVGTEESESIGKVLMKISTHGSRNHFWGLDNAWKQCFGALSISIRGSYHIDHCSTFGQCMLLRTLANTLTSCGLISTTDHSALLSTILKNGESAAIASLLGLLNAKLGMLREQEVNMSVLLNLTKEVLTSLHRWNANETSSKRISMFTHIGMLWALSGFLSIQWHYEFISSLQGMDPNTVAQSLLTFSAKSIVEGVSKQCAYKLMRNNRIGGDHPTKNIPVISVKRSVDENIERLQIAHSRMVERSETRVPFSSYEATVVSTKSMLSQLVEEDGLLAKLVRGLPPDTLKHSLDQLQMSKKSFEGLLAIFDIRGSMSHFRDVSTDFEFGLSQCLYGFSLLSSALRSKVCSFDQENSRKLSFFSSLSMFPPCAFYDMAMDAPMLITECLKSFRNGPFLLAIAKYFVGSILRDGNESADAVCASFDIVAQAWKFSLLNNEEEAERKSSLYILREATQLDGIAAMNIIKGMEQDEQVDFVETFNPISCEMEDAMLGVSDDTKSELQNAQVEDDNLNDTTVKIDPSAFWQLHHRAFPSGRGLKIGKSDILSSFEDMVSLSKLFHHNYKSVPIGSESPANVWNTVCADKAVQDFSAKIDEGSYNFYKSSNPSELAQASSVLHSCLTSIDKVQRTSFKDTGPHPVLEEVAIAIERLAKSCKADTPLSFLVLGIENVLRKADEWHRLFATKPTRIDSDTESLSRLVVRWRKLEMSSWNLLLKERRIRHEKQASKWFFLLYDVIINHNIDAGSGLDEWKKEIPVLVDKFLRSSPFGEFASRVHMVLSLSKHLSSVSEGDYERQEIARLIRNISTFYAMYIPGVEDAINTFEQPSFAKLKDFMKLVKWTATEDLGSSQKMSKEKNKYLEYYRLKAASEKTRRRLHKLCLDIDAILRKPVYEYLAKDVVRIGLKTLTCEDIESSKTFGCSVSFSKRIPHANNQLCSILVKNNVSNAEFMQFDSASGLLSRVPQLKKSMTKVGCDISENGGLSFLLANRSIEHLRSVIKLQVTELRSAEGGNIQKKQRSFIELLRALRKMGLSPFGFSSVHGYSELSSFFSNSDPTNCEAFNNVADDLLMVCVRQVLRLHEVSDARVRNSDISRDESSKAVSFCNQLLTQSSVERKVFSECMGSLAEFDNRVTVLENLCDRDSDETTANASISLSDLTKLKNDIRRLKNMREDFGVFKHLLYSTSASSKLPSLISSTENVRNDIDISLQKLISEDSASDLMIISNGITSCCTAISDVLDNEDIDRISKTPSRLISLYQNGIANACVRISSSIKELSSKLSKILISVSHLSSANLLSLLIEPTLKFLRNCLSNRTDYLNNGTVMANSSDSTLSKIKNNANDLIERVLLSTQQTLTWAGIDQQEDKVKPVEEDEDRELTKNSISISHKKLKILFSVTGLSETCALLLENEILVEHFLAEAKSASPSQRRDAINIQSALGQFLRSYLNDVLIPIFTKCTRYHCDALSLLRTLSSLIVGLFVEGYCRPQNEANAEDGGEDQDVSGTGFGDVDDGDISSAQNVSNQIEDEEQLIGLKNDEKDEQPNEQQNEQQEEDAFDMTTDFDGQMEDAPNQDSEKDDENDGQSGDEEDIEKQLSKELEKGKDILDERLWGEDDENADEAEESDKKDESEGKQTSSDLVAKDAEETEDNRKKEKKSEKDKQKDKDTDIAQNEDDVEDDNGEEADTSQKENGMEESDDTKEETSRKKGTDGKPLDEGEDEEDEDKSNNDDDVQDDDDVQGEEKDAEKENSKESAGQVEHDSNGDSSKLDGPDAMEDENNVDDKNDVDMEDTSKDGENSTENDTNPDGNVDDEEMVGDSTNMVPEDLDLHKDEGDLDKENEEFADKNGGLDLGNLSASDSEEDDGHDEDMEEDGAGDGKSEEEQDDSSENEHGDGDGMNENDDDDNTNNARDMTEGTATTMQSGHDGHQAFQDDGQSNANLNNDSNQANDQETSTGIGSEDVTGKSTGEGTGDRSMTDKADGENDEKNSEPGIQDPNPLRALTDETLIEHWQDVLDRLKQARETADISDEGQRDGKERSEDKGKQWEFAKEEESDENVAIGAATEEQHKSLPTVEQEEDVERHAEKDEDKSDSVETGPKQSQPAKKNTNNDQENDDGDEQMNDKTDGDGDRGNQTKEDEITVLPHPARQAVEREDAAATDKMDVADATGNETNDQLMKEVDVDNGVEESDDDAAKSVDKDIVIQGQKIESLNEEEGCELWRQMDKKVSRDANILCEELRLVLEATEKSGMGGGYRSGKRLNMRKVIEFVASDFRKDRIWMRRVRAEKRAYDVMMAIDDSASMAEGMAGAMALEAAALVTLALGKLEVGRVAITRFGAETQSVRDFDSALPMSVEDGGAMLRQFTFSQKETDVVDLLRFVQQRMGEDGGSDQRLSLVLVISDGHLSKREEVGRLVRMLKERRVLVAFIIVDGVGAGTGAGGANSTKSILDVKRVEYDDKGNVRVLPYMDDFPVPFYVVVQKMRDLPRVMAESLRHWIEMASL